MDVQPTLTHQTLNALLHNDLLAVRVRRFWRGTADMADTARVFTPYMGAPAHSGLTKCGPVQCEYVHKAEYFAAARAARHPAAPFRALHEALAHAAQSAVDTAHEADFGPYHVGVTQRMRGEGMLLHMDYAPADARGWAIDTIASQLACVVHLGSPKRGGVTRVYARAYDGTRDDVHRVAHSYHFDDAVVRDAAHVDVQAAAGDLVMFNSRNFHRVSASEGSRLTLNAFFGRTRDGRFWMWS